MTYYDEFIVVGGKAEIPLNYWLSIIVVLGILGIFWFFINDYIFGEVGKFRDIKEDLRNATESQFNVFDILESDYKFEEPESKKKSPPKDKEVQMTEDGDDRKAPLDLDG